jgi:hypothetical protein
MIVACFTDGRFPEAEYEAQLKSAFCWCEFAGVASAAANGQFFDNLIRDPWEMFISSL